MCEENSEDDVSWRGCPMTEVHDGDAWRLEHVPPVHPSDVHTVLYHFPIKNVDLPPKPLRGPNKWDAGHVRLPCSTNSQYPVTKPDSSVSIESRWELIQQALLRPISNSRKLEAAILSYNMKYEKIWKFRALHELFEKELCDEEANIFFEDLLPKIIRLALRLPELVASSVPLLRQGQNRSITLSQQQIACLLANAFLCTFPRRNTTKRKSEYSTFPDINFNRLFQSHGAPILEKIKCICNYFRRVCNSTPLGVVTFVRRSMNEDQLPKWNDCDSLLGETVLHVSSVGTIEENGRGLLQVDFANRFLGGGVLGSGCVQEEIRFVICPELMVSKLFTEALKPLESLVIVGCEQFNKYEGYASTFTWSGNFEDHTPYDSSRRRRCNIVAIDALHFLQSSHQYREELMLRELNKAYVGFYHSLDTRAPGVASGNWGCGAFGGEATLKALLQLMVCTITKRPLVYFTFGNVELRDALHGIYTFFIENNVKVNQLWCYLKEFRVQNLSPPDLYNFICKLHRDKSLKRNLGTGKYLTNCEHSSDKKLMHQIPTSSNINEASKNSKPSNNQTESHHHKNNPNTSSDIFASSSSSSNLSDSPPTSANGLKNPNNSNTIELRKLSKSCSTPSNQNPVTKKDPRQRSLLEMLDVLYAEESPKKRKFPV